MFPGGFAGVVVSPWGVVTIRTPRPVFNFLLVATHQRANSSLACYPLLREGFTCTGIPLPREATCESGKSEEEVVRRIGTPRIDSPVSVLEGREFPYAERREP
jgi:hypothetical protein